ncbi:uncharacterized protein LOC120325823 [Styela clava]
MDSIVPTQSLQAIFTPILSQITELLIVTSEKYESETSGGSINILRPLVSMSEDIVESLKDLTTVCQQTVTLEYAKDNVVKKEIDCGSQNLLVAGESLVLCCHILCSATKPDYQLKTPVPYQNDVPGCLSELNQCMMHLLLSIDDAEVRKIASYGWSTSECLATLATADTLQNLNDKFRSFAIPAADLHRAASARCNDLLDDKLQYKLKCSLSTLRQSLPMLTAALQMAIRYPDNDEVLKGRDFCVEQVRKAIADIVKVITTKNIRKSFLPGTKIGLFYEKLNEIKKMLSAENRKKMNLMNLHTSVEGFVQYAMDLSLTLVKSSSPLELKSNAIVTSCRKMMRSMRDLEKADEALHTQTSIEKNLRQVHDEKCMSLSAISQGTVAAILHAVTVLVTHIFRSMDEPLVELIDSCISPKTITQDSMDKMQQHKESEIEKIKELTKVFSKHTNDITTAARFAASCSQHAAVYHKYSKVLFNFDQTSRAIITATSQYTKDKKDEPSEALTQNDKILDLQDKWIIVLGDLIHLIVASLDLKGLLDVIVDDVVSSLEKCTEGIVNMNEAQVATSLQRWMGKSRFLVRVANAVVSCSTEPLYRNGVLSHVKTLKQHIANCIARGNQLIEDIGRVEEQELFSNSADHLLESIRAVSEAILSEGNHPDLTSINRMNVRNEDTSQTNSVLKEMMALNEKLTSLGFEPITDEELDVSYPVPTSSEPGWPRYYYKDDQQAQHQEKMISSTTDGASIISESRSHEDMIDLESLPGKIHPVIENLMSCLKKAFNRKSSRNIELEKAKELVSKASEMCIDIARDTLLESQITRPKDENNHSVQKASCRVGTLGDLILREADDLRSSNSSELDLESLSILGLQWSKALYIISIGCTRILPLYIVPVRRYLALSLDADINDVHSLAKCIISYPGSVANFIAKLASFKENVRSKEDKSSIGDFNVHEQNVKELLQLIDAISTFMTNEENEEETTKSEEISALCEIMDFDWSTASQTKEEILKYVNDLSPTVENDLDKSILQLLCLAWSSKVHSLHCSVMRTSKLILESFNVKMQHVPLYEMLLHSNGPEPAEINNYKQQLLEQLENSKDVLNLTSRSRDALIETWSENLLVTSNVIEEILEHLRIVSPIIPIVFHHGHSMFHFVYLHHLFFLILSYLKLCMQKKDNQEHLTERSDTEKRLSLSARLQRLKEDRERRDESLNDVLTGVPKIDV